MDLIRLRNRCGMLILERCVLYVVVCAALLGMAVYMKRAVCGNYRGLADSIGHGRQYQPGVTTDGNGLPVP